jgi:hypothetical protein
MYGLILQFLSKAFRLYNKNTASRALIALWNPDDLVRFDDNFRECESHLDMEAQNCEACHNKIERMASFQRAQELGNLLIELKDLWDLTDPIFRMDKRVATLWERSNRDERIKILEWTSKIRQEDHHRAARDQRTSGTGEWIFKNPQFNAWVESEESMILWLHGIRR